MKPQGGFTLVELMVTIGITGILASVAMPMFVGLRHKVHMSEAYSQMHTLFKGQAAYFVTPFTVKHDGFWGIDDPPERTECRTSCLFPVNPNPTADGIGRITVPDPTKPIVVDNTSSGWALNCIALGFDVSAPTRFAYMNWINAGNGNRFLAGGVCPNPGAAFIPGGSPMYENGAFYRIGEEIGQYAEYIYMNDNRELYRAGREFKPDVQPETCAIRRGRSAGAPAWLACLIAMLACRRLRHRRPRRPSTYASTVRVRLLTHWYAFNSRGLPRFKREK